MGVKPFIFAHFGCPLLIWSVRDHGTFPSPRLIIDPDHGLGGVSLSPAAIAEVITTTSFTTSVVEDESTNVAVFMNFS